MDIKLKELKIRDLTADYEDNEEGGVIGYGGELDIRPPYQREFIYRDKQRDAVIETVFNGFPLNVMYWAVRDQGGYEVIDGQQRTISICQYRAGDFAYKGRYFHNLQTDEKERFLNYDLMVYLCSGSDSERLAWFEIINIAGAQLTKQELRNAVYSGPWVTDAKRYFSKKNAPAYGLASKYVTGELNRQAFLETAIGWINNGDIVGYMAEHQYDPNANELWLYFQAVIAWVQATYPTYRPEMKSVPWGELYNQFKDQPFDSKKLDAEVTRLMLDEDVERKKGIYSYLLDGKEKHLNIRAFSPAMRREAYERQLGICPDCKEHFELEAWRLITSSRGMKAVVRQRPIAKCSAWRTTAARAANNSPRHRRRKKVSVLQSPIYGSSCRMNADAPFSAALTRRPLARETRESSALTTNIREDWAQPIQ